MTTAFAAQMLSSESDLEFIERLLAEEGLSYRFEHLEDDATQDADSKGHARHVLVISDTAAFAPDLGEVRFTHQHVTANGDSQKDAVTAFMVSRRVAANAVTRGAWDYKRLAGTSATDASSLDLGDLPTLEVYDGSGAYRQENAAHAERTPLSPWRPSNSATNSSRVHGSNLGAAPGKAPNKHLQNEPEPPKSTPGKPPQLDRCK